MYMPRLGGKFKPQYLPVVFTGLEYTPLVANTSKYWSTEHFQLERTTEILTKLI